MGKRPQTTAARIRAARLAAGISQLELSARLGVRQSHVSEWETGTRGVSLEMVWAIAQALEADPHQLDPRLCPAKISGFDDQIHRR
jgi:transcriptional regulator with XRE-family HTH domain